MLSIIYFFLGASLGSFIGLICDRFPEKSIIFPIPLRYLFMELFCGVICLLYFYDFLSLEVTYFLYFSLCLSIFDLRHKSYPLLIWIVGTVPLLFMGNYYLTFALGITIATLSYMKHLNIGEGDFLYLASASLIFSFSKILLILRNAFHLSHFFF